MPSWSSRPAGRYFAAAVLVLSVFAALQPASAHAVGFQQAYMRLDRMKISTATGGTVCATPASTATEAKVIVTFPTTYTLNTTAANWTVTTTNLPAGATVWPGITTASAVDNTAKTATFGSSDLTVGTMYCFNFSGTNTVTTASAAANNQQANIKTQTSANVEIDYTNIALANIADDQILVTAVVPPSFSFALSGNTDTFGTLDATVLNSTAGRTVSIATNAKGGWIAWAKDSQQGLYSPTSGYKIATTGTVNATPQTLTALSEGYGLDTDLTTDASGGCTLAIDAEYNGTVASGTAASVGAYSANFQPIATCAGTPPATSNGDVITLIQRATIANSTPAASDYSDIVTVVGAGNF